MQKQEKRSGLNYQFPVLLAFILQLFLDNWQFYFLHLKSLIQVEVQSWRNKVSLELIKRTRALLEVYFLYDEKSKGTVTLPSIKSLRSGTCVNMENLCPTIFFFLGKSSKSQFKRSSFSKLRSYPAFQCHSPILSTDLLPMKAPGLAEQALFH